MNDIDRQLAETQFSLDSLERKAVLASESNSEVFVLAQETPRRLLCRMHVSLTNEN